MKVGCGFVEKNIGGRQYLYVWFFQPRGHGYRKVERSIGPPMSPKARGKALQELEVYASRALAELDRRRAHRRRQLSRP
jgi:hypothetical protein